MEFHPKSEANFLAIRKDLYSSAPGGRLYRTRIPSASGVTSSSSSLATLGSLSSSTENGTYQSQHETRFHLLQVSANERLGYDIFGSPLHGSVGSDVVSSPERIEGLRHVDCCDEDGNTEDDDDNPRLYIDHHLAECKYNNNFQQQPPQQQQQQQQHSTSFECSECGKGFASKAVLSRHLRTHLTSTNNITTSPQTAATWRFQCSLCDSSFERPDELSLHEHQNHFLQKKSTAATRSRHLSHTNSNTVHSTTTPTPGLPQPQSDSSKTIYECEQPGCLRHYTSYSSFMKHRKTHSSASQQHQQAALSAVSSSDMTAVTTCGGAVSPTDSKRHSGEKKFQCGQCSKRFPTSKDLKRHDVVHTGNREFQCSFCSHRFGRKDHRMRHEKKTHAAELSPPNAPQQQQQQQQTIQPTQQHNSSYKKSSSSSSPPQNNHPSSPSRIVSTPVLLQQQDQLVVQRQPQWSRRALTPPLPSPHGLKMEHYMDTIDEDSTLSPLMEDDSMSERKPLDLQKILGNDSNNEDGFQTSSTPTSNGTVPLDEMTLTSEDADDECCCDDVKSGLDWIITEFMSEDDLPKINERVGGGRESSSSRGFYSPEETVKPEPVSDPYQVPAPSLSAAPPSPKECEMVFGDFLTRTKNPVLPSVYVDNSQPLIMPEPSKQRYQNSVVASPRSLLLEENEDDFMADVDVFLREKDIFSNI